MLHGQLEEAARKNRQNLIIFSLCGIVFLLSIALLLLFTNSFGNKKAEDTPQPLTSSPTAEPALNPAELPIDRPVEPQQGTTQTSNKEVLSLVSQFEETIEPKLMASEFQAWDGTLPQQLLAEKQQAIENLATGKTDQAFDQFTNLIKRATDALAEFEGEFAAAMDNARSALSVDAYREANIAISRAVSLKPTDPDALDLKERIEMLPKILSLIEQAEIAKTENNLLKEQQLSEEISRLDPTRTTYTNRAVAIEKLLVNQKYEDVVISGNEAARSNDLKSLQQSVQVARSLFPDRAETQDLEAKLVALKRKIAFNAFMTNAHSAVSNDDWKAALTAYQQAETIHPNDQEVKGGIALSSQIIQHQNTLQKFNQDPERLANEAIKKSAKNALQDASTLGAISPNLGTQIEHLKANIEKYNRLIEITVISDGLTNVSVRGVGQVGTVTEYSIRLKPGKYRLEGKRQGYKTKSVSITVSPEDTNMRVEIIADERI